MTKYIIVTFSAAYPNIRKLSSIRSTMPLSSGPIRTYSVPTLAGLISRALRIERLISLAEGVFVVLGRLSKYRSRTVVEDGVPLRVAVVQL